MAAFDQAGIVMPETTLRVVGVGGDVGDGTEDMQATVPRPPSDAAVVAAAASSAEAVDAVMDAELDRIVATERAEKKDDDLLQRNAPEE